MLVQNMSRKNRGVHAGHSGGDSHRGTCGIEALSPYTFNRGGDDTGTYTHQSQFAARLRGVLSRINARIREAVAEEDLFGLRDEALADDVPEEVFRFETTQRKLAGFMAWLRDQLDSQYLEVVGPDRNQFIRAAYAQGIRTAQQNLGDLDVSFSRPDMDELLGRPVHRTALQTLYTRTYEELSEVSNDVAEAVRDELVTGLRDGQNPRKIARNLTSRVDSIGKHRSTLIARSEIMNAHSESSISRYEEVSQQSDTDIGLRHGEWQDSSDGRVCAFCRRLSGAQLTFNEMRNTTVRFRGDIYRLMPPSHIQGRCIVKPSIGIDPESLAPLSERVPGQVVS